MKILIFLLSLSLLMTSCKVGPDYSPPEICMPTNFIEDQPQRTIFIEDRELVNWWKDTFKDPCLDQLLEETLSCNFDLRIALEKVYQARANYWVQFTAILPEIDSDFQATRFRTSQSFSSSRTPTATAASIDSSISPPIPPIPPTPVNAASTRISPTQDFFQIGLDAIWEIDLFGRLRRTAQSAHYSWEASIEDYRGIKITVLSEVANRYVSIRYFQQKVNLAKQLIQFDQDLKAMAEERFQTGLANEEEVLQAMSILEFDKAALKVLEISLTQNIYSLAILLGRFPETLLHDFSIERPIPISSGKIPQTLPCELLRRRPDIASAERTLAAQTELIGAAVAELFPKISLTGSSSSFAANPLQGANIGFSSDKISKLFNSSSLVWGVGTLITWPVFDFGKRWANVDIQKLITEQAYLTYEKTVITALQEVETALATYFKEEERLFYFTNQVTVDQRNLTLIADQFQAGLANYTQVVQAKEKWLTSVNSSVDSQQALSTDLIAIYKAIGGDW